MNIKKLIIGEHIDLLHMMDAREQRVKHQSALLEANHHTLISFTLNIAGPVKVFPLSIKTYNEGKTLIQNTCKAHGVHIIHFEEDIHPSGYEAYYLSDAEPKRVKKLLTALEESSSLGRLFDIDVLTPDGVKVSRTEVGYGERSCLLCGKNAFVCSRSRAHTLDEILTRTCQIMWDYFALQYAKQTATTAVRALLYEVGATPKPGLVDRHDNGSHSDMDIFTFEKSAIAILPYFTEMVSTGIFHAHSYHGTTLDLIRPIGIEAESAMLLATGGVNTHKGIIFSMGILLTSLGIWYGSDETHTEGLPDDNVLREIIKKLSSPLISDFKHIQSSSTSHGEQLYLKYGIRGARGEAIDGFPSLYDVALPSFETYHHAGLSLNDMGVHTLIDILANTDDTNVIFRSSYENMKSIREELSKFTLTEMSEDEYLSHVEELNARFISEHISPGGSADILALAYFIWFLKHGTP